MRLVEIRRVSTEEQAKDDRSGLDRQAAENRRTAERVGAALVEPPIVITDVCFSGALFVIHSTAGV